MKTPRALYIPPDLPKSAAFLALSGKAPQVLLLFYCRRQVEKLKRAGPRGEHWRDLNAGQIVFTYREAEKLSLSAGKFRRAIDDLIEHGFLDVTKSGSGLKGDYSLYGISHRWQAWGTPDFVVKHRPKGRAWQTEAAFTNTRGAAFTNARCSTVPTFADARCLDQKPASGNAHEHTCSIDYQSVTPLLFQRQQDTAKSSGP
jgi:hypothetical protein